MIGFNRRFSPLTKKIKNVVGSGPMTMIYRINAGAFQKILGFKIWKLVVAVF